MCHLLPILARAFVAFLLLAPAPVTGEKLMEAYRLALQSDPKYRAAQADALANGTAIDQARAGFLPTVNFNYEKSDTRQRVYSSENPLVVPGVTTFPTENQTFSVTQPIFRKEVIERYTQAKAVVRQAQFTVLAAEQDLQLRTDDALARFSLSQAREIEARNRLRDARQALREIIGRSIEKLSTLREDFPLVSPEPALVERWLESAFDNNLLLKARREGVEVAKQEIERQRAGHYPSLNLLLNRNRRDSGSTLFGGGSDVETTDLMLRLSVPLFEGGLTRAVTQEAVYRYQKALEELEQERRALDRTTRAAFDGAVSGVQLAQALRQSVISQESALVGKEEGYRTGLFTLLPVLDAQRDLYLAKRDHAQSRYDYVFNRLRLKQAAGTLSEADLASIDAALR
jgi:outer membrane protein